MSPTVSCVSPRTLTVFSIPSSRVLAALEDFVCLFECHWCQFFHTHLHLHFDFSPHLPSGDTTLKTVRSMCTFFSTYFFSAFGCLACSEFPVYGLQAQPHVFSPCTRMLGEFFVNLHSHTLPSPPTQWCFHFKIVRPPSMHPLVAFPHAVAPFPTRLDMFSGPNR